MKWVPVVGECDPQGIYTLRGKTDDGRTTEINLCGECLPTAADKMRDAGMTLTMKVHFECDTRIIAMFYCSQCNPKLKKTRPERKGRFWAWPEKNK